ncbi:MAG TPA: hypothetical protein VMP13_04810 [Acidimicrobiia bacterium]|nr:hypothetical protein [Acidimicrobiia bacterium]
MRRGLTVVVLAGAFLGSVLAGSYLFLGEGGDNFAHAPSDAPPVFDIERDPDVPPLPFDDNPDPSQCGIPVQWGDEDNLAWLSGFWRGELIQPEVLIYDSHLRKSVAGGAPHGTLVEIVLYQENPVLDYYMVRIPGSPAQVGWIPEPFLSFEPVA